MDPSVRVGDDDREQVLGRLNKAFSEGRLDKTELEERLGRLYTAKTGADLVPLTSDLPAEPRPVDPGPSLVRQLTAPLRYLTPFLFPCVVVTIVWALTGADNFWPVWVYFGMAIAAFGTFFGFDLWNRDS